MMAREFSAIYSDLQALWDKYNLAKQAEDAAHAATVEAARAVAAVTSEWSAAKQELENVEQTVKGFVSGIADYLGGGSDGSTDSSQA